MVLLPLLSRRRFKSLGLAAIPVVFGKLTTELLVDPFQGTAYCTPFFAELG
jgi:hypothetical protein